MIRVDPKKFDKVKDNTLHILELMDEQIRLLEMSIKGQKQRREVVSQFVHACHIGDQRLIDELGPMITKGQGMYIRETWQEAKKRELVVAELLLRRKEARDAEPK